MEIEKRNDGVMIKEYIKKDLSEISVSYEEVLTGPSEFIVRKRTGDNSEIFVFNPAMKQVYIKNENTGKIKIGKKLPKTHIAAFFDQWSALGYEISNNIIDICSQYFMVNILPKIAKNDFLLDMMNHGFTSADILFAIDKSNNPNTYIRGHHGIATYSSMCAKILIFVYGKRSTKKREDAWKVKDAIMSSIKNTYFIRVEGSLKKIPDDKHAQLEYFVTNYPYAFTLMLENINEFLIAFNIEDEVQLNNYLKKIINFMAARKGYFFKNKPVPDGDIPESYFTDLYNGFFEGDDLGEDAYYKDKITVYSSPDSKFKAAIDFMYSSYIKIYMDGVRVADADYHRITFFKDIRPDKEFLTYLKGFINDNDNYGILKEFFI